MLKLTLDFRCIVETGDVGVPTDDVSSSVVVPPLLKLLMVLAKLVTLRVSPKSDSCSEFSGTDDGDGVFALRSECTEIRFSVLGARKSDSLRYFLELKVCYC